MPMSEPGRAPSRGHRGQRCCASWKTHPMPCRHLHQHTRELACPRLRSRGENRSSSRCHVVAVLLGQRDAPGTGRTAPSRATPRTQGVTSCSVPPLEEPWSLAASPAAAVRWAAGSKDFSTLAPKLAPGQYTAGLSPVSCTLSPFALLPQT